MIETEPTADELEYQTARRKHWLKLATLIFGAIAILYAIYWFGWDQFDDYTNDAYIDGNQVSLMPQIAGTVTGINTDNTYLVKQGQNLVDLDKTDALVALQKAEANLAETVRNVHQYYEEAAQAQAEIELRKVQLDLAKRNLQRRQGLLGVQAISNEEMQIYISQEQAAQAQYDLAVHKLAALTVLVANSSLYDHPLVQQAKLQLKTAYLAYVRTTLYAPVSGIAARRNVQIGQQVRPGSMLLAIVPLNQIWVEANFKESQLKRVRIGQKADVTADANSYTYHGVVVGLAAGTGSAFSLLPAQNATGNWIKIVQRLPVRIALDPKELAKHPLQIGLSTEVVIHTRSTKGLILPNVVQGQLLYSTPIYAQQLAGADKLIAQIIHKNAPENISI